MQVGEVLGLLSAGFSFTTQLLYVTIGDGMSFINGFNGGLLIGAGMTTSLGIRIGKFHMGLPIDLDIFDGTAATTFALTLGFAI